MPVHFRLIVPMNANEHEKIFQKYEFSKRLYLIHEKGSFATKSRISFCTPTHFSPFRLTKYNFHFSAIVLANRNQLKIALTIKRVTKVQHFDSRTRSRNSRFESLIDITNTVRRRWQVLINISPKKPQQFAEFSNSSPYSYIRTCQWWLV